MRQKTPLEKLFDDIKNDKNKEMYDAFKEVGYMMHTQKKAFVAAGFTENQAMEIVIADYLDNKHLGGN